MEKAKKLIIFAEHSNTNYFIVRKMIQFWTTRHVNYEKI